MMQATKISQRRACALVGLSRDSVRNPPAKPAKDQSLRQRIVQLAHERRRFGYRRIADMLRADGEVVNDKRVYRLYRAEDLAVRKRRGKKRLKLERMPLHVCSAINEVWSLDFVSDSLANGRRLKCLAITDDYSHECVDLAVDFGMGGEYVTHPRSGRDLPRLPASRANRTGTGVHVSGVHGVGAGPRRAPHPEPGRQADADRVHRVVQRQATRRVPERALVRDASSGA